MRSLLSGCGEINVCRRQIHTHNTTISTQHTAHNTQHTTNNTHNTTHNTHNTQTTHTSLTCRKARDNPVRREFVLPDYVDNYTGYVREGQTLQNEQVLVDCVAVFCVLYVVCCLLSVACCLLSVVCCLFYCVCVCVFGIFILGVLCVFLILRDL